MYSVIEKYQEGMRYLFRVKTPSVLTMEGWDAYTTAFKAERPIAYFATEFVVDLMYDVARPFAEARRRTHCYFKRYDLIRTGLPKTKYHEIDTLILHGNFSLLADFVEIELASQYCAMLDDLEERKKYNVPRYFFWWTNWRSAEAGIKELELEMEYRNENGLPDMQANAAKEILEIYNWWKNVRPNRPDAYAEYNAYRKEHPFNGGPNTKEECDVISTIMATIDAIEDKYYAEDTEMMTRLINIRNKLWS